MHIITVILEFLVLGAIITGLIYEDRIALKEKAIIQKIKNLFGGDRI